MPKLIKSRARKFAVGAVLFTGLMAFALFQMHGPRMPVYQGKPLSKWFDDYMRAIQMQQANGSPGQLSESDKAFREFGQEAVPFLIYQLTNKSGLKEKYISVKSSAPGWVFKILPRVQVGDWASRTAAARALGEIGPPASNAIPQLIDATSKTEIYETDKSTGASGGYTYSRPARIEAIHALIKIAPASREVVTALVEAMNRKYPYIPGPARSTPDTEAEVAGAALTNLGFEFRDQVPLMIANLKHQDQRQYRGAGMSAIYSVGSLVPGYGEHVPKLVNALKDSAVETRDAAAYDLGALRKQDRAEAKVALPALENALSDAEALIRIRVIETILAIDSERTMQVVPVSIKLMEETNYLIRLRAIDSLRMMGAKAKKAIPALTAALQDETVTIQTWAAEALKQIDPEVATNAGIK